MDCFDDSCRIYCVNDESLANKYHYNGFSSQYGDFWCAYFHRFCPGPVGFDILTHQVHVPYLYETWMWAGCCPKHITVLGHQQTNCWLYIEHVLCLSVLSNDFFWVDDVIQSVPRDLAKSRSTLCLYFVDGKWIVTDVKTSHGWSSQMAVRNKMAGFTRQAALSFQRLISYSLSLAHTVISLSITEGQESRI